jgi:hypothetical protein
MGSKYIVIGEIRIKKYLISKVTYKSVSIESSIEKKYTLIDKLKNRKKSFQRRKTMMLEILYENDEHKLSSLLFYENKKWMKYQDKLNSLKNEEIEQILEALKYEK